MAEDVAFLSATQLLALCRTKDLSPAEVMGETLRRLARYEGAINAFALYDPEEAMTLARASEARWRKGEPEGLLDGVPVDTVLTRDWPRLLGSRTIDPNQQWNEDSPITARLRRPAPCFSERRRHRNSVGNRSQIRRSAESPAIHGTSSARPVVAVGAALLQ